MVTLASGVSVGGSIDADNYNLLRDRVVKILGTGEDRYGYGQSTVSTQVTGNDILNDIDGDLVSAQHMANLRADIEKCWKHQTTATFNLGEVATDDFISAGTSTADATYNQYFYYVNQIDTNKLNLANGQYTDTSHFNNSTPSSWGGNKSTTEWRDAYFTIAFGSNENRRFFFNSGGQIIFTWTTGSIGTGASAQKNQNWKNLIANMNYTATHASREATASTANALYPGNWITLLTSTNDTSTAGGDYAENEGFIQVRCIDNGATIQYYIRLNDKDIGDDTTPSDGFSYSTDEPVTLPISVNIPTRTATGSWVSRAIPSVTNPNTL